MGEASFDLQRRDGPLILSAPHVGLGLPADIADGLTSQGLDLEDADHAVHQLYDFAEDLGATTLFARLSRYVVDLNRPPDGVSLYPGQTTTGLVPTETFKGVPLWRPGCEPDEAEIARRVALYWRPYHDQLTAEIARIRAQHGYCLLWDCHSIEGVLPRLFEGRLPMLNLGSFDGRATPPDLARKVLEAANDASFSKVLDGRFKGGFITRNYGRPQERVFALQLEIAQDAYLVPPARTPDPGKHDRLRPVLKAMIDTFLSEAKRHV